MKLIVLLLLSLISRSYGISSATSCPSGYNKYQVYYGLLNYAVSDADAISTCNTYNAYSASVYYYYTRFIFPAVYNTYGYCCKPYDTTSSDCTNAQHHVKPTALNTDATCEQDTVFYCKAGQDFRDGGKTSDGSCGNYCAHSQRTTNMVLEGYGKVFNGECSNYIDYSLGFSYELVNIGSTHIIGSGYKTLADPTSASACRDACVEYYDAIGSYTDVYSSYATNSVGCRCATHYNDAHAYSYGTGVYKMFNQKYIGTINIYDCSRTCNNLGAKGFIHQQDTGSTASAACYCEWSDSSKCDRTYTSAWKRFDIADHTTVSKSLCEDYAKSIGKSFVHANKGTEPKGCYRRYYNGDNSVWYNDCTYWNCPKSYSTFTVIELRSTSTCLGDTITSCGAGNSFYNGGQAFNGMCIPCANNQYSSGGTTSSCTADSITSCSAGYKFSDGGPTSNGYCTACATNQHSAGGTVTYCSADTITSCSAGNGFSNGGKEYDGSCTQCTAITQYSPGGTSACQDKSLLSCSIGSGYTDGGISSDNTCTQCADTQYTPPTVVLITSGSPRFDYSMTAAECEAYAESIGKSFNERNTGTEPKGCYRNFYNGGDGVSYNPCTGWLNPCPKASTTFQIVDIQYTSSCLQDTYLSCDSNVGYDNGGAEYDSTCTICLPNQYSSGFMPCATQTFDRRYAVMDLGSVQNVVGMATRGRVDYDQRVTRYRLQYSTDGKEYFSINSEEFYFVREGECSEGTELRMYEGNGDNEGTMEERTNRCYEACISEKTPITGSYSSCTMSGFIVFSSGRCYCECEDSSTCSPIVNGYHRYDIAPNGVFEANHDRDTVVSNYFQPVRARYVKLNIVAYDWEPTIQMAPIVSNSKQKVMNPPDSMRNSLACGSSMLDAKGTCLSANGNLTIDLGKVQIVVGVVTQGRSDLGEGVVEVTSGSPQLSMTQEECEAYASSKGFTYQIGNFLTLAQGCLNVVGSNHVRFNEHASSNVCSSEFTCLEKGQVSEYVTTYKLSYATADHFTDIQHTNRRFPANRDQHTKVTNYFEPVRARYIRLTPVTSKNAPSLRMGVVVMEKSIETELLEPKKKDRFEHTEVEYKDSIVYFGGVREYKKERNGKCASKQKGRVQGILTHDYVKVEGLKVDNLARVKFTTAYLLVQQ